MPDQSGTRSETVQADVVDAQGESRRGFLRLGAVVVAGFVDACAAEGPSDVPHGSGGKSNGTGGSGNGGTTPGNGGATNGGSGNGGTTQGSGGAQGGYTAAQGGAQGGSPAQGGSSQGGKSAAGGSSSGGSGVTGGTSAGGAGGGGGVATGSGGSTGMPPDKSTWVENRGSGCTVGTPPTFSNATANAKLPDLFKFLNGMRITKKEDWACLRADLSAAAQACIYGPKMPPPDKLTATFSGGKVTVNMTVGSQTGSFTFSITGGGTAAKPVPVLITCGGSSLGTLSGVARIDMANNSMAAESKTVASGGLVHTLYGSKASKSGSLIGWAWGASRIIDALQLLPEAGIDTKRIAVTGCSRNGKGALAMGAFDERVALTIPQEGGSGGPALWRVSEKEKAMGQNIQESAEIVGEANWQGSDFKSYANGQNAKLSADQHTVIALCAPRAVLVIDNDIDWLGPVACYGGGAAARMLYEGLGIKDRCGVSVAANHGHCQFPSSQQKALDAFVNRFLKGMSVDTGGVDDHAATNSKLKTFDTATWIDWTIPTLSGSLAWDPFA